MVYGGNRLLALQRRISHYSQELRMGLLLLVSLLTLFAAGCYGYYIGWGGQLDTPQTLLRTLIAAQASALTILFTVVFAATQLVATRYSPQLTTSLIRSRIAKGGFALILLSILVNAAVFLFASRTQYQETLVSVAIAVPFVLLLWLYPFISVLISKATPDGLLDEFAERHDTHRFAGQAMQARAAKSQHKHPLQPIYDLSRASIRRDETAVSNHGKNVIHSVCMMTLKDLPSYDCKQIWGDVTVDEFAEALFRPPVGFYLPHLAEEYAQRDYYDISSEAVLYIRQIGEKALDVDFVPVFETACNSFAQMVRNGGMEDTDHTKAVMESAIHRFSELYADAAHHNSSALISITESLFGAARTAFVEDDDLVHSKVAFNVFKSLAVAYLQLFEQYGEKYAELSEEDLKGKPHNPSTSTPDFISDVVNNAGRRGLSGWEPREEHDDVDVAALINWRILFESLTGYYSLKSKWPREPDFPSPEYLQVWKSIVIHAMNHPPKAHAKILVKRFVELLAHYQRASEEGQYILELSVHLSEAAVEGDIKLVQTVFDEIFDNVGDPSENIKYRAFNGSSRSTYWIPAREGDYNDDFIEAAEELHEWMMNDYERRIANRDAEEGSVPHKASSTNWF